MFKQILIISSISLLLLTGCADTTPLRSSKVAWDGLGRDPNAPPLKKRIQSAPSEQRSATNRERERLLETLVPYSNDWWAVYDKIESEKDRDLRLKLVICEGCVSRSPPHDETGSISKQP